MQGMPRDPDTSLGGRGREFPTTPSFVKEEGWDRGLDELTRIYWKPVYLYIRMIWKASNEESKDLAQQFFLTAVRRQMMEKYQATRGPFRTYIKTCLKNFLVDEHRKRKLDTRPLDDPDMAAVKEDAEQEFEKTWVQSLIEEAMTEVRESFQSEGKELYWSLFEAYDLRDADSDKQTYTELGREHNLDEAQVRRILASVRGRLREKVVAQVRRSVSDPKDFASELAHLGLI